MMDDDTRQQTILSNVKNLIDNSFYCYECEEWFDCRKNTDSLCEHLSPHATPTENT